MHEARAKAPDLRAMAHQNDRFRVGFRVFGAFEQMPFACSKSVKMLGTLLVVPVLSKSGRETVQTGVGKRKPILYMLTDGELKPAIGPSAFMS